MPALKEVRCWTIKKLYISAYIKCFWLNLGVKWHNFKIKRKTLTKQQALKQLRCGKIVENLDIGAYHYQYKFIGESLHQRRVWGDPEDWKKAPNDNFLIDTWFQIVEKTE